MRSQEVLRMIKVVRFMSFSEFLGLIEGKELENTKNHKEEDDCKTDSIGFCFTPIDEFKDDTLYKIAQYLCSVATTKFCVVADIDEAKLKKGYGIYADHSEDDKMSLRDLIDPSKWKSMTVDEYSTTKYSLKDLENARWFLPENEGVGFWYMEWKNPVEITDKVNKKRREKNA